MGLNMYWRASKNAEEKTRALLSGDDPNVMQELGYFRKFHALNDFMGSLYDGVSDFNTVDLKIGEGELADMRAWAKTFDFSEEADDPGWAENLKHDTLDLRDRIETDDPEWAESLKRDTFDLCDRIETALAEGRDVIYWPWW